MFEFFHRFWCNFFNRPPLIKIGVLNLRGIDTNVVQYCWESINNQNEIREVKNSIADFKHDGWGPSYPFGVRWATYSPKNLEINTTNSIFILFEKYSGIMLAVTSYSLIKKILSCLGFTNIRFKVRG